MRLRLVGIQFSGLVRGDYQMNLFEDTEEIMALYQAMDRMKSAMARMLLPEVLEQY